MNKKYLRVEYIRKRISLSDEDFNEINNQIVTRFLQQFWKLEVDVVHSYLPILSKREVNTWPIIEWFRDKGTKVVIPRSNFKTSVMEHFVLNEESILVENAWGIKEPMEGENVEPGKIDASLIPLLIFDENGHRVGYGKGFYDRYLKKCRQDSLKIGLSLFPPVKKIDDVDRYDIRLDYCITPDKIYTFRNPSLFDNH